MSASRFITTTPTTISMPMASITGKSRASIAATNSRPVPGIEKIVSVTTAPPVSWPIDMPTKVITGRMAFGAAWRNATRHSPSPLACATRMNGRCTTLAYSARYTIEKAPK